MTADLEFFFDPVCPFCWNASRWVRLVEDRKGLDVRWRFISLRMLNEGHYDEKPDGYPDAHERGLQMLRVAAAARQEIGEDVVGRLYHAMGEAVWHQEPPQVDSDDQEDHFDAVLAHTAQAGDLEAMLTRVDLPTELAAAATDDTWDDLIRADTKEALDRAGEDVGTPILSFDPPDGPAFFGPVISEVPGPDDAVRLWEAVETLGRWPGFAELKRSLRHFPATPLTAEIAGQETTVS
ncbi:MAG: hypothetical protein KY437_09695 [Actinobacteria bacterium]|nr:hypothetical protein [Actinomycetota bacterium]